MPVQLQLSSNLFMFQSDAIDHDLLLEEGAWINRGRYRAVLVAECRRRAAAGSEAARDILKSEAIPIEAASDPPPEPELPHVESDPDSTDWSSSDTEDDAVEDGQA